MKKIALSAVGHDQPGIVTAVTQVLFDTRCNIEDTHMTILEDHFTMLFILQAPEGLTLEALEERFRAETGAFHLHLALHEINTESEDLQTQGAPWMISVSCTDQTGIMYHVTRYLSSQGINIRQLSSKRLSQHGEKLFLMAMEVDVPASVDEDRLQADLQRLAKEEHLELHAEPLEVYTL